MRRFFVAVALCGLQAGLMAAVDYTDPAVEQRLTKVVQVSDYRPGGLAPTFSGDEIICKSTADSATSLAVPGKYDCSKGIKFEFDFCPDKVQSNPFPRILEARGISVHLSNVSAKDGKWEIKALSATDSGSSQARTHFKFGENRWYHVIVRVDPAATLLSIQLDNEDEVRATLPDCFEPGKEVTFSLGNVSLGKFSKRGYSGKIRNLQVVYPYNPQRNLDFKAAGPSKVPLSHAGVNIQYIKAQAMPKRNFYFPGFAVLQDGSWGVVSREGEEHICPYGRIVFSRSMDAGKNFSVPMSLVDGPGDERDPALIQLSDGRLLMIWRDALSWNDPTLRGRFPEATAYLNATGTRLNNFFYQFSNDNGVTWEPAIKVPGFSPHGPCYYNGNFYQPTIAVRNGRRYIDLQKGSSDAKVWETIGTIAESPTEDPGTIQEPHVTALTDGTLVCAIRIHSDGYMRISRSTDGGRTWSPMVKTPVRGFPQHLLQLADGRLMATYGYRYYPLGVRACFSKDGGLTWDVANEVVIRDRGLHGDLGYPVSVQLADGRIATCYYYNSNEYNACHVEIAIWQP